MEAGGYGCDVRASKCAPTGFGIASNVTTMDVDRIAALRIEYESLGIDEEALGDDPVVAFEQWFEEAADAGVEQANTFVLATADAHGRPSARAVLMKGFSPAGVVFYTNRESRKGADLATNPRVAACFVWQSLRRQVRIEGVVEEVAEADSDAYFSSRPLGARLAAAASPQSRVVADRSVLDDRFTELEARHPQGDVPRPPAWGGYRIVPEVFEFWQGRPNRFHDRIRFRSAGEGWVAERLAP